MPCQELFDTNMKSPDTSVQEHVQRAIGIETWLRTLSVTLETACGSDSRGGYAKNVWRMALFVSK